MASTFPFSPLIRRRFVALLWCTTAALILVPLQSMAALALDGGPQQAEQELDEVTAEASPLWKLRREVRETEERFYARYNQLNTNDEFDVHCSEQAPLGSRLRARKCRIAFQQEADVEMARAYMRALVESTVQMGQALDLGSTALEDPELVFFGRRDDYHRHALAVINGDAELRKLASAREDLGKRYNKALQSYFKDRWLRQ